MTWQAVAADALLVIGVAVELLCCVGMLAMRTPYDRLHYLGPASLVGPLAITAAIILEEAFSGAGIQTLLVCAVLVFGGPVISHATVRAIRIHEFGSWQPQSDEAVEEA